MFLGQQEPTSEAPHGAGESSYESRWKPGTKTLPLPSDTDALPHLCASTEGANEGSKKCLARLPGPFAEPPKPVSGAGVALALLQAWLGRMLLGSLDFWVGHQLSAFTFLDKDKKRKMENSNPPCPLIPSGELGPT